MTATPTLVALLAVLAAAPATAGTIAGTVWTDPEGDGIDDVVVYAIDERFHLYADGADASGGYNITDVPAGAYRVWAVPGDATNRVDRVWPDSTDFCTAERLVLADADEVDNIDFSLEQGGGITGRLLDPDGTPVEGALVTAISDGTSSTAMDREAETDADGWFDIVGLDAAPGENRPWTIAVEDDALPDQFLVDGGATYEGAEAAQHQVGVGEVLDIDEFAVLQGILVTGRVEAPDGSTISDGTVHVYSESQIRSVPVEENGTWLAEGLPPGSVLPWVSASGYALTYYPDADRPTEWVDSPGEGGVLENVVLLPPVESTLSIRLEAEDGGAPFADDWDGAGVLLYNDTYTVGSGDGVDAEGRVTLDGLHGGTYYLHIFAAQQGFLDEWLLNDAGERSTVEVPTESASDELVVSLERGARLSGVVLDDSGLPVYGATVTATTAAGDDSRSGTTDRDGTYEIVGLRHGAWTVAAGYAPICNIDGGYVTAYLPGTVDPGAAESIDLSAGDRLTDVDFTLPRDADLDQMGDDWEDAHGLDSSRDDSGEDPDDDGLTNLEEYRLGLDPQSPNTATGRRCGCQDSGTDSALLLPLLPLFGMRRRRR